MGKTYIDYKRNSQGRRKEGRKEARKQGTSLKEGKKRNLELLEIQRFYDHRVSKVTSNFKA
jgi:hypothetical protein